MIDHCTVPVRADDHYFYVFGFPRYYTFQEMPIIKSYYGDGYTFSSRPMVSKNKTIHEMIDEMHATIGNAQVEMSKVMDDINDTMSKFSRYAKKH